MTALPERLQDVIAEMRAQASGNYDVSTDQVDTWADRIEAATALQSGGERDRERDRARYPDSELNKWLDEIIADGGIDVWCAVQDIDSAWAAWDARAFYASPAQPSGFALDATERGVIETLLNVAYASWSLADNTEDAGAIADLTISRTDFEDLCVHLDALEKLPDDQPGYTMHEAAKARWALRRLLAAAPAPIEQEG